MEKPDKRTIILNAAMKLLAEQGFHGGPMAKIAEAAGVGAGTIYRYFENRDVLIMEVYQIIFEEFRHFIMTQYPADRPIRERFFHVGRKMIDFNLSHPVHFSYSEQFHHSPYGLEFRKRKLDNSTGEFDFCHDLLIEGRENQVIKDLPLVLFFNLGFAPMFWAVRDHHTGFLELNEALIDVVITSCWDSIKM